MKIEKTEFGNKTDFIGPYNYNIFLNDLKYIYNSDNAIIISSNKYQKQEIIWFYRTI